VTSSAVHGIYHLYKGVRAALSVTAGFFLFSIYYSCTHRLLPVVLAHLFIDVLALIAYAARGS
jgi:membrane protease YdiL (CAAX protease family)